MEVKHKMELNEELGESSSFSQYHCILFLLLILIKDAHLI